jgi:hypothetical protein
MYLTYCLTAIGLEVSCPDGTTLAQRMFPRQTVRELKQAIAKVRRTETVRKTAAWSFVSAC